MNEDRVLLEISLRQLISQLDTEEDRAMVLLYYQMEDPVDYKGCWPPTFASVATYIGEKYGSGALAESTIRYRMRILLSKWRHHEHLRG
jgi:hypothetical protein